MIVGALHCMCVSMERTSTVLPMQDNMLVHSSHGASSHSISSCMLGSFAWLPALCSSFQVVMVYQLHTPDCRRVVALLLVSCSLLAGCFDGACSSGTATAVVAAAAGAHGVCWYYNAEGVMHDCPLQ